MGDVWSADKLSLFLAFFVPGFISLQIYGLFVGVDDDDLMKRLPAIVGHSAIHYALFGWIILAMPEGFPRSVAAYIVVLVLPIFWTPFILLSRDYEKWKGVFFKKKMPVVAPLSLGIGAGAVIVIEIYKIQIDPVVCVIGVSLIAFVALFSGFNWEQIVCAALKPEATPWDRILTADPRYIRMRLKNGRFIGGYLGRGSSISAYPCEAEIFISQAFSINQENGIFGDALKNTGILVKGTEIESLETIELEPQGETHE